MSNNEHLVPLPLIDLGEKAMMENIAEHHRETYIQRLEAAQAYIQRAIYRAKNMPKKDFKK